MLVTARISRNGEKVTTIPAAVNFNGFLAQQYEKGVGEPIQKAAINSYGEGEEWEEYAKYVKALRPFFNKATFSTAEEMDQIKKDLTGKTIQEVIGTVYEKHLIKWGENEGGLLVEDMDQLKALELAQKIAAEGFEMKLINFSVEPGGDEDTCYQYEVRSIATGKTFGFYDRNIFDFGRVINPIGGGIAINVESFISRNSFSFGNSETADEYRRDHPTSTGWGWSKTNEWVPMEQDELDAYKIVEKYGKAGRGIRL